MRSFFNKPAWAKTDDEPSAPEFYRRSHQTYKDILKANREQRREEAAKSALKPTVESTKVPVRSSKRRRISDQDEEPSEDALERNEHKSNSSSPPVEQSDETCSIEYAESRRHSEDVDEEEDALNRELLAAESHRTLSPEVQVVEEPPRFQKYLSRHRPTLSPENDNNTSSSRDVVPANVGKAKAALDTQEYTDRKADKKAEIVVEILVTSEIENTKPLIVRRHMSQRFRDIRLTWCARQGFDQKMTDSVYLTWNKRRLFDVTTCKSLDVSSLSSLSTELDFEDEPHALLIHVEAVTDEFLKARAEAEKLAMAPPAPSQTVESEAFHIVLKSPGHGDLRVKVLPRTPVLQIITNFKSKRNISSDSKILLSFDGDILDPNSQLKDYDIDDMDLVEVILR